LLVLDAHPLLANILRGELREQRPEAWRAAHRRLYEHLCATTKDKAQPSCPRSKTGELHRIVDSVRLNLREAEGPSTETPQARRGSKIDWTSAAKDALLWVPAGGHGHPVKHLGLASRCAGLWVVRASIPAPRTNGAQTMSTLSIKSRNTKSAAPKKGSAQSKTASRRKVTSPAANAKRPTRSVESKTERVAAAKTRVKIDQPKVERVTKQERVLTLLSQSEGASIEEMMQATDWQQHSVRGFLAGTVKRKLGFSLTSLKPNDGVRRYRIETRRTR
jgi:hypothetical protein